MIKNYWLVLSLFILFFLLGFLTAFCFFQKELALEEPLETTETREVRDLGLIDNWSYEILRKGQNEIIDLEIGPSNQFILAEKTGQVYFSDDLNTWQEYYIDWLQPPAIELGGGLLGLTSGFELEVDKYIYFFYIYKSKINSEFFGRISRFTVNNDRLVDENIFLDNLPITFSRIAGHLSMKDNGDLFVSLGDFGDSSSSQDLSSFAGKILRFHFDGSIPPDNPYPGNPIFAWGLRNPSKIIFDKDNTFFIEEQTDFSQIYNLVIGQNYGWPIMTHPSYLFSIKESLSGLGFCHSCLYPKDSQSHLSQRDFVVSTSLNKLLFLKNDLQQELKIDGFDFIKILSIDSQGQIYLSAQDKNNDNLLLKLSFDY